MDIRLKKPWVYLITDRKACKPRDLIDLIETAARSGVDLIQIRERDLTDRSICGLVESANEAVKPYGTIILVNDRFDVALACGARGVHLTTQSIPTHIVRRHVGSRFIIGVSTHSREEVEAAERGKADFVVLGPVFDTPSKRPYGPPIGLESFSQVVHQATIPVLGLGGMSLTNFPQVLACGASGIAGIRLFIEMSSMKDGVQTIKGHPRQD